jgi:hypothetical protein
LSTDISEIRAASIIALMTESAQTSETTVDNYFTRQYILEDKSEVINHLFDKNRSRIPTYELIIYLLAY